MEKKNVLLSIKDLVVKFKVRGRILTAIRGISLDIYENESIAIVGESGSGKSVFTKTFAGMLDSNGFIDNGSLIFNDDELATTNVKKDFGYKIIRKFLYKALDKFSKRKHSSKEYNELLELKAKEKQLKNISNEDLEMFEKKHKDLLFAYTELFNYKQTLDSRKDSGLISETNAKMKSLKQEMVSLEKEERATILAHKKAYFADTAHIFEYNKNVLELKNKIKELRKQPIDKPQMKQNVVLGKEIYLSVGRYPFLKRLFLIISLYKQIIDAFNRGLDLNNEDIKNDLFDKVVFRVAVVDDNDEMLYGKCISNLAKVKYTKDWQQIRGKRIATIFQDPMTSLNPIITIGKQITSIIVKHQHVSESEARKQAIILMQKVGIPNAEDRFDDYPFQYSGGMRQRIVIAIALSCQPKILICDEPTTALDVTIQAQILKLIKDLQKEFGYTIVFITHDLGVVANIADRVAVLYAGQIVELGEVREVFFDPRHPYTWALLSSLPQLAEKGSELYSINGTPPSLYNKIVGDPFAPRNPYCMKIDTLMDSPMFKVTDTHYAKTWLLDPRSPKVNKPSILNDIHGTLVKVFNVTEED